MRALLQTGSFADGTTTIPLTDPKVISLFSGTEAPGVTPEQIGSNTGTYGVPEFGTKFVRQMLEETKPTTMDELVRISGLSHGTDVWIGNAQEIVKHGIAPFSSCICTRDDIMNALMDYGVAPKMAFDTMEFVRKGKGLPPGKESRVLRPRITVPPRVRERKRRISVGRENRRSPS